MSIPRSLEVWLVALLLAMAPLAHAEGDDTVQRQRIERERGQVDAQTRAGEEACAERFAVSSCLAQIRSERRAQMQKLDHQRALLDDAQRKRRAADRQARVRERQDAAAQAEESRTPPPARPSLGAAAPLPPASAAEADAPAAAAPAGQPRGRSAAAAEKAAAARRAAASKRRVAEAAAHRVAVEKKIEQRALQRLPAAPLPIPSAPR